MKKYEKIESRNGSFWLMREGSKKWVAHRAPHDAQPASRALWCRTQREASANAGAANVAHGA